VSFPTSNHQAPQNTLIVFGILNFKIPLKTVNLNFWFAICLINMLSAGIAQVFLRSVSGSKRVVTPSYSPNFLFRRWWSSKHDERERILVPPIPRDKLHFSFSASSGPGGQNVNHVNTKVELRFKPSEAHWIPIEMRQRFIDMNANRMNKEGEMIITSQRERKQEQNLEDCVAKLKQYLVQASYIPKERIATEVPEHENEKRIQQKRARSNIKQGRSKNYDH
jgi:protein subunit release factor B